MILDSDKMNSDILRGRVERGQSSVHLVLHFHCSLTGDTHGETHGGQAVRPVTPIDIISENRK